MLTKAKSQTNLEGTRDSLYFCIVQTIYGVKMTFEEDFPSLKGKRVYTYTGQFNAFLVKTIKENCLDKKKVEETIDKKLPKLLGAEIKKELGL
jgi:hypothetical protein